MPPAAHAVARPKFLFSCAKVRNRLVIRRTPVAANGCPKASEPPRTFSFSAGTGPSTSSRPSLVRKNSLSSNIFRFDSTWAANASCTSIKSTSASFRPARSKASGVEYTLPSSMFSRGSCPENA